MRCWLDGRLILLDACRGSSTQPRVRRWKALCAKFHSKQKGRILAALYLLGNQTLSSEHFDIFNVNGVSGHLPGNCNVMALVSLEHIRIVNVHYFLVAVGDNNRFRAFSQTLSHAGGVARVGAFDATIGEAHITANRL